jgi:hypothetical protein
LALNQDPREHRNTEIAVLVYDLLGVEKHAVTPAKAGVQCCGLNMINGFWTPASAGVTVFQRISRFSTPW